MSIEGCLKQICAKTLALLKRNSSLIDEFFEARSIFKQLPPDYDQLIGYRRECIENRFLHDWKMPELNLGEYWQPLTYLLSGYLPGQALMWIVPELEIYKGDENRSFLPFLVTKESQWDGLPLVNAFGGGREIGYEIGYAPIRYLLPQEVEQILEGLLQISEQGFQDRCRRDAEQTKPSWIINWSDSEQVDGLRNLYRRLVNYYRDAVSNYSAMLIYIT